MSKKKKPDRSSRAYYQYRQKRTRLVASILAIVLALAMFFAYVIEAGLFANLGGAPPEKPAGDAFRIFTSAVQDGAAANADAQTSDTDASDSTTPPAEDDAANAEAAAALAADDPASAAGKLTLVTDRDLYESTLRAILNDRYESGASNEDLAPFTSQLDTRGTQIADRYARAYDERTGAADIDYLPTELLLTDLDGDEQALRDAVPADVGEVTEIIQSGDMSTAVVSLTLEWPVQDAAATFANSGFHAQPDYIYTIQEEPEATVPADGTQRDAGEQADSETDSTPAQPAENAAPESESDTADETAPSEEVMPAEETIPAEPAMPSEEPAEEPTAAPAEAPSDLTALFSKSQAALALQECWDLLATNGTTVRVGVLDTGLYSEHEDIDDVLAKDPETGALLSGNFENGQIVPGAVTERDASTHGTHVCGIIAAEANGTGTAGVTAGYSEAREAADSTVTPVTELVAVCGYTYFSSSNSWGFSSTSLTKAINYLVEKECKIINLSLGGTTKYDDLPVMGAITNAIDHNVILVAAAGNTTKDKNKQTIYPPYISYPGFYTSVISVINAETADKRYSSSNYGPDYDIAAPGTSLYSTTHIAVKDKEGNITGYTDYGTKIGTSMATPVITGIAAMMLYEDPNLTPRQIRNILYATAGNQLSADEKPAAGEVNTSSAFQGSPENRGNALGFGYVDPVAALNAVHARLDGAQSYADYVELNRTVIDDLEVGDPPRSRTTLEYRLLPATATVPITENGTGIRWTSSNPDVATVSENGIVTAVGHGSCTITGTCPGAGQNGSEVSASVAVTINSIDISDATVTGITDQTFTGEPVGQTKTKVTLEDGTVLTEGSDYTMTCTYNVDAGTARWTIRGIGHYYGTIEGTFQITPKLLTTEMFTLTPDTYTYNGSAIQPDVTGTDGDRQLARGADFDVTYANNINKGTATVTVTGTGNYTGTITKSFQIKPKPLTAGMFTLSPDTYTYDGSTKQPTVTGKDEDLALARGTDFDITTYVDNTEAGTATVTITGKGNYTGTVTESFQIQPKPLTTEMFNLSADSYSYDGRAKQPTVDGMDGDYPLFSGADYSITYADNTKAGTASVVINGTGNYSGTITKSFQIEPKPLTTEMFTLSPDTYTYDGSAKQPAVTGKDEDFALARGTDFDVTYKNNIQAGTATVAITGRGNYTDSVTKTFTILPAPKHGWHKEGGYWYFYDNTGKTVKSAWRKDSKGWCYLGADGRMVANGWAKDSKGWCWMNGSGYWDNRTRWIKYDGGWYHTTNGYRDQNKWKKDSKGWCYLGSNGRMVTNGWAKDSKGWCWMGANGYWTSSKWVKDKGEWYYIKPNHYMAANEWAKDSAGWMYMAGNGKVTKSKWIKSGGAWYYLKANGYMATGTQRIGGKTYHFASSGKWIR